MNKFRSRLLLISLGISFLVPFDHGKLHGLAAAQTASAGRATPRYIFLFLADGAGVSHMEITRQYSRVIHNEGLVISDKIMKEGTLGLMTTHAADALSTDSAAAATALACGCKAKLGAVGVCADGTVPRTAVEIALERRLRVGVVTTAPVYDASPAAFVTHGPNRRDYRAIIDRYLEVAPDVLLGGGRDQFLPKGQPGSSRSDDKDIIAAFTGKGYAYASSKQQLEQIRGAKILGLFSRRDMSFELDRDPLTEPSIYDMTRAAIRLLEEKNQRGFFLFVENENVDSAAHLSDVASVIRDYREFDRALGLAYDFYRKHPRETLIIVTSDHETGGLGFTAALRDLDAPRRDNRPMAAQEEALRAIQSISISLRKASQILGPMPTPAAVDELMRDYFGRFTLAPDIKDAIVNRRPLTRALYVDLTANALGMMVANNTQAYWQTAGHTNHPVFIAAIGPGAERFKGYQDNVDFGKSLRSILEGGSPPSKARPEHAP
jgi:alkaline phosphatase